MQPWLPSSTAREPSDQLRCSAKGCRQPAVYVVVWNNPKIHAPGREKMWLACEQHRDRLADFLDMRGFLLRVDEL